jgi:RND family efflux transporter MFP subunit
MNTVIHPTRASEPETERLDSRTTGRSSPIRSASHTRLVWSVLGVASLAGLGIWTAQSGILRGAPQRSEVTATVVKSKLSMSVAEGGQLESAQTIDVLCEVEGQQIKIVEMLPEGTPVTAGQVVIRLDASEISRLLIEQEIKLKRADAQAKTAKAAFEIQKNKNASAIAQANLALKLAELDRKKYMEGEYMVLVNDLKGSIALAQADLQETQDTLEYFRNLVKHGFRTPEQLRAKAQVVMRAQYYLNRDEEKLRVLEQFTRERQEVELTAKAAEATRELERVQSSSEAELARAAVDLEAAEVTARLEQSVVEKLQQQLEGCIIRAPQDGVVIYDNRSSRIQLGAMVHFQQKLFSLPDLNQMQVECYIHESVVKQVKPGLEAELRLDAFPNLALHGRVKNVATFRDSDRYYTQGVKSYRTIVQMDQVPDVALKPGMTAEVRILVGELPDVLIIPLQAVAERDGRYYCYVLGPSGFERRGVSIGENNDAFVEIRQGLAQGDQVALDARARTDTESEAAITNDHGRSPLDGPEPALVTDAATASSTSH